MIKFAKLILPSLLLVIIEDKSTSAITGAPQIVGTFAEFERAMLRERALTGLDAARKQGRIGGRRPTLRTHQQDEVIHLVISGQKTAADAARLFNVHPATISRLLKRHRLGT